MVIKCVAIDDEPLALEVLSKYISGFPMLKLVRTFEDAINGAEFLKHNETDLLFIDINMPDVNGIDLVRSLLHKPMIIFTTAYRKFAMEGFEEDAVDYLLKPIPPERFAKAVNKAMDYYRLRQLPALQAQEEEEALFVNADYQKVKIQPADIEYIESIDDYIKIHLLNQKPIMTLLTLKAMLARLPANKFIRIHRSYVVPVAKIKSIVNRKVKLTNTELPISSSYIDAVNDWMKR